MAKIDELFLEIPLTNRNSGQGNAWYATHKQKQECVEYLKLNNKVRSTPILGPVALRVVRLYSGRSRAWDSDSILRGNLKQILDSMCSVGWFIDDGPNYIMQTVGEQQKTDGKTGTLIEIYDKPARFT